MKVNSMINNDSNKPVENNSKIYAILYNKVSEMYMELEDKYIKLEEELSIFMESNSRLASELLILRNELDTCQEQLNEVST